MSDRKEHSDSNSDDGQAKKKLTGRDRASLGGETVEPRILLSTTWVATAADPFPIDAYKYTFVGGGENDVIVFGTTDPATDPIPLGASVFSSPTAGQIYTVSGGQGDDTIVLSQFDSSDVTLEDGSMSVDLGGGETFQIVYDGIETIRFGDHTASVLTGDLSGQYFTGDNYFVDGNHEFRVAVNDGAHVSLTYDNLNNVLSIDDINGADPASTRVAIQDLGTGNLSVDHVRLDEDIASLSSSVDIGLLELAGGSPDTIAVGGGSGTIGTLHVGDVSDPMVVRADVQTMHVHGPITGTLAITGDVGNITTGAIDGTVAIRGDLTSLTTSHIAETGKVLVHGASTDTTFVIGGREITVPSDDGVLILDGATQTAEFVPYVTTADAGSDQIVDAGSLVTLDATGSTDPQNDTLHYRWEQIEGPTVQLSDVFAAKPTFVAPEGHGNEILRFRLIVTDGTHVDVDTVDVALENTAPVLTIASTSMVESGSSVNLTVSASDADGDPLSYSWRQVSGPAVSLGTTSEPSITFDAPDVDTVTSLTFEIAVYDGHTTITRQVTVRVEPTTDPVAVQATRVDPAVSSTTETTSVQVADSTEIEELGTTSELTTNTTDTTTDEASDSTNSSVTPGATLDSTMESESDDGSSEVSTTLDAETTQTTENDLDAFLPDATPIVEAEAATSVTITAGDDVSLSLPIQASSKEEIECYWTQVAGTDVDIADTHDPSLQFSVPESFLSEELVFKVEMKVDGRTIEQEVTVRVEPVDAMTRSEVMDGTGIGVEHADLADDTLVEERGIGKIWASLVAFLGARPKGRQR